MNSRWLAKSSYCAKPGEVMTTYVLVHGGHHGGWCYQKVTRLLRTAGHEVYSPTLTGLGERRHLLSPDVDLEMHIADLVSVLTFEDLHDVAFRTRIIQLEDVLAWLKNRVSYLDRLIHRQNGFFVPRVRLCSDVDARCERSAAHQR